MLYKQYFKRLFDSIIPIKAGQGMNNDTVSYFDDLKETEEEIRYELNNY